MFEASRAISKRSLQIILFIGRVGKILDCQLEKLVSHKSNTLTLLYFVRYNETISQNHLLTI